MTDLKTTLTAAMATAYFETNKVPIEDVEMVIRAIYGALDDAERGGLAEPEPCVERPTPAQIKRSIRGDKLISFEDGRAYSTLKRHLTTRGMTPDEYRAKWGLPADYPMVAPEYAARRSALAIALGLGRKAGTKKGRK
ncbi:MAG: MucR family transcriptional regulator [Microcystis flos-aquae DF17]|nr:MAG: MucR family transcriptional regulator [Microcystis flos-aquae DF17]